MYNCMPLWLKICVITIYIKNKFFVSFVNLFEYIDKNLPFVYDDDDFYVL